MQPTTTDALKSCPWTPANIRKWQKSNKSAYWNLQHKLARKKSKGFSWKKVLPEDLEQQAKNYAKVLQVTQNLAALNVSLRLTLQEYVIVLNVTADSFEIPAPSNEQNNTTAYR